MMFGLSSDCSSVGQLLLVGLVLEVLDVHLHARMGRLVVLGDLVPVPLMLVLLDMEHADGDVGESRRPGQRPRWP